MPISEAAAADDEGLRGPEPSILVAKSNVQAAIDLAINPRLFQGLPARKWLEKQSWQAIQG